jgi:hypothetical protein|tara:strand:- start:401 stop:667 length:267 start_codon:yes stop_codon:yes gene_type:complete
MTQLSLDLEKPIPPVIIFWNDAWGEDNSVDLKDIDNNPILTTSIGWLLVEDEIGVTISMDSYPSMPKDFRSTAHIPRGMITKIVYLKE